MSKVVVYFRSSDKYCNLIADDMHEDDGFLKVYNGTELVGMFLIEDIKAAWKSEVKQS